MTNSQLVPLVRSFTCLGVNLDEPLKWSEHIEMIIGTLQRIKSLISACKLQTIYCVLKQVYFDYYSPLGGRLFSLRGGGFATNNLKINFKNFKTEQREQLLVPILIRDLLMSSQSKRRSIRDKFDEVKLLSKLCSFDILAITDTYLDGNISNKQLEIEQYRIVRRDRNTGFIGGGCLVYVAYHICFSRLKSLESSDIEGIWLKIKLNSTTLALGTVYRPPSDSASFQRLDLMLQRVWLNIETL